MGAFLSDLKYAVRMLRTRPGLAVVSIVALGLGIGLITTMWSIVYGVLLRDLPFEDSAQIVAVERTNPLRQFQSDNVVVLDFDAWRAEQTTFEDLAAYSVGPVNLTGVGRPERFRGTHMTPSAFTLLRTRPYLGRVFHEDEGMFGGPRPLILSYNAWRSRFGADSSVIGRTVRAAGAPAEIIGVMPIGFGFPESQELWLPLQIDRRNERRGPGAREVAVFGRLRHGVTIQRAAEDLQAADNRLARDYPQTNEGFQPVVMPYRKKVLDRDVYTVLWTSLGAVIGILLLACSNVANLLLARVAARSREIAVRTALGAGRWRIVSQILAEALLLAGAGAVLGTGIAVAGVRLFTDAVYSRTQVPFMIDIRVDAPVLLFVTAITVLTSLVAGVLPAMHASGTRVSEALKDASRGASSLRMGRLAKALVMTEIALACGLLVASEFMILSVVQRARLNFGVPTENVFTAAVTTFDETAFRDSAGRQQFWQGLIQRLEALPGQRGVALASVLPGRRAGIGRFELEGSTYTRDGDRPAARLAFVSPGYFPTFQLRALEGRLLASGDIGGALPVVVVTRQFATRFFPGDSPVGRRIRLDLGSVAAPWLTIVGVVPDVWYQGTDPGSELGTPQAIFIPLLQRDVRAVTIAIAASGGDALRFAEPVRAAMAELRPDEPIYDVATLQRAIANDGWGTTVFGALFTVFGVAALLLATIGVYGVMAFSVTRRTHEVGVRMALGADRREVMRMFLRQGAFHIGGGLVFGLELAIPLSQGLRALAFGVDTRNPAVYVGVMIVLAAAGLAATLIPAMRAARVEPVVALRRE